MFRGSGGGCLVFVVRPMACGQLVGDWSSHGFVCLYAIFFPPFHQYISRIPNQLLLGAVGGKDFSHSLSNKQRERVACFLTFSRWAEA